jgi:potassium efflux system protein
VRGRGAMRAWGVLAALVTAACGLALALADLTQPAQTTPEAIQQRIDQVQSAGGVDQSLKDQLLKEYNQALASARDAQTQAAQTAAAAGQDRSAPQEVARIRKELSERPAAPNVQADSRSPGELEQSLAQARDAVAEARKALAAVEAEQQGRTSRSDVASRQEKARSQIDEVNAELAVPPQPGPPELAAAHTTALRAHKDDLQAELDRCAQQAQGYDARGELLRARHDKAARDLQDALAQADQWQQLLLDKEQQEARAQAASADKTAQDYPELRAAARHNRELANALGPSLAGKVRQARSDLGQVQTSRDRLQADLTDIKSKVATAGLTRGMGSFLRKRLSELPNPAALQSHLQNIQAQMADAQSAQLQYLDERDALSNLDSAVQQELDAIKPPPSPSRRQELVPALHDLLADRKEVLTRLVDAYDGYFNALEGLAQAESSYVNVVKEYGEFVNSNILWFRSSSPLGPAVAPNLVQAVRWCLLPANYLDVIHALIADVQAVPLFYALAAAIVAGLLVFSMRFRSELGRLSDLVSDIETDSIVHTLKALLMTVLLTLPWPLLAGFLGWRLEAAQDASEVARAVGAGLWALALALLSIDLPRRLCLEHGLADQHFRWRSRPSQVARRNLAWLLPLALPGVFLVAAFRAQPELRWTESVGRLCLVLLMVLAAMFAARVLRFRGGILQEAMARRPDGWLTRLRYFWLLGGILAPLGLAAAAGSGFYYTAVVLGKRLVWTAWLLMALMVAYELMMRLLFVLRRRLAREQMRKRRAAEQAQREEKEGAEAPKAAVEEPEVSIYAISAQTQQLIRSGVWVCVFIILYLVWGDVLPALNKVGRLSLSPILPVSMGAVFLALAAVAVTVLAAKNIPGLLEIALLQHLPLEQAVRFAITTVCRYGIVLVGLVLAANILGVKWEKVQWLAAAVTVGIGFGLQEIIANFVSGIIILFERPLRVGDTITVGDTTGTVTRIRIRATTILDWDRKELVVPNKEFITGRLINWTLSDRLLRVVLTVGIAYGSDTELACARLLEVAKACDLVLAEPEPQVYFAQFGDSSLDFELRVHVASVEAFRRVPHVLHMAIDKAFREAGIEISFPQRDVHIRSIEAALPVEERRPEEGG